LQRADVSAPPWAADDERQGPRKHVIIDGDSLEKLATRYLDDPRRGSEIFELNRELLSSPDVLPIGVELRIPDRRMQTSWDQRSGALVPAAGSRVREAVRNNLVPIRSANFDDPQIIPRARLSGPIRAE
jgi:hypothetical protein